MIQVHWMAWMMMRDLMICDQCGARMIHGGSHDGEDYGADSFLIVNNHTCPECGVLVLEYIPKQEDDDDDE